MRPASQRFFIHSCIYLRILIISYLATLLDTNSLSVLMCRKAVNQSIRLWDKGLCMFLVVIEIMHPYDDNMIVIIVKIADNPVIMIYSLQLFMFVNWHLITNMILGRPFCFCWLFRGTDGWVDANWRVMDVMTTCFIKRWTCCHRTSSTVATLFDLWLTAVMIRVIRLSKVCDNLL